MIMDTITDIDNISYKPFILSISTTTIMQPMKMVTLKVLGKTTATIVIFVFLFSTSSIECIVLATLAAFVISEVLGLLDPKEAAFL